MEEKFIIWFKEELPELVHKNIISQKIANVLSEYYDHKLKTLTQKTKTQPEPTFSELATFDIKKQPEKTKAKTQTASQKPTETNTKINKLSVSAILTVIASILISSGIISLIAYNWAAIPRIIKAVTAITLLLATQTIGVLLIKSGKSEQIKIRESYSIFWALLFGGIIAFVSQIFRFAGDTFTFLFVWSISSIMIHSLFKAHTSYWFAFFLTVILSLSGEIGDFAIFQFLLCALLYFYARKSKLRKIPLCIFASIFFLIFMYDSHIPDFLKNTILVMILSSVGLIFLSKESIKKKYFGIILLCATFLISLYYSLDLNIFSNYFTSPSSAIHIVNIIFISFITLGFFTEGAILPFIKKVKTSDLSLDNLLYLIPLVLALNPLFAKQAGLFLLNSTKIAECYKIFICPFSLTILYTSIMFVTTSIKKSKASWIFLSLLFVESLWALDLPEYLPTVFYIIIILAIFILGTFLRKNNFTLDEEHALPIVILRCIAALLFFTIAFMARNFFGIDDLYSTGKTPGFITFCYIPALIYGIIQFVKFAKKSTQNFLKNLDILVNIIFSALIVVFARNTNQTEIILAVNIFALLNLICASIIAIKREKYSFLVYAGLSLFYFLASYLNIASSITFLYLISVTLIFIVGLFLWKNDYILNPQSKMGLIIIRIIAVSILFVVNILAQNASSLLYNNSGIDKFILFAYTPLAIVGLVLYTFFARKEFKTFLLNIDIIFNLSFISVLYVVAHKLNPSGVQLALEILLILNMLASSIFLFYFKKNESSVYFIPSIIYYFIKLSYSSNQNATANFFLIVSLISIFIHSYALIKNNKSLKNISAIITGIVLFYETSLRYANEGDFTSIEFSFFTLAFLIIVGLSVIYNLIKLIRNKLLFNPAIFLTPLLVILLTKIQDKFSILITFPIVLLFCVYYFYLSYKEDSLKLANLSTIYLGLTLMVRFFSSGYGLAIQGLTFIAMGILLLVTNLLISKKRGLK